MRLVWQSTNRHHVMLVGQYAMDRVLLGRARFAQRVQVTHLYSST